MSAFIVDRAHIDTLIQAMLTYELIVPEMADETGRILWNENLASIHARYPDTITDGDYPGPIDFTPIDVDQYTFVPMDGRVDPEVAEIAADSYAYQSCEHARWGRGCAARTLFTQLMQVCDDRKAEYVARFGPLDRQQLQRVIGAWTVDSREIYVRAEQVRALNLTKEPV